MATIRWLARFTVKVNWKKRRHNIHSDLMAVVSETPTEFVLGHKGIAATTTVSKSDIPNFIFLNEINKLRTQIRASIQEYDFRSLLEVEFWVGGEDPIPEYYYGDFIVLALKHDLLIKSWDRRKQGQSH